MRLPVPDGLARWRRQRSRRRDAPVGNAAPVSQAMTSGELAASLRPIHGQRDKGKHPPNLHLRSKPVPALPQRSRPDLRRRPAGGDSEPVTASAPKQRQVLPEQVQAHVTAEPASRQRKRGQGRKNAIRRAGARLSRALGVAARTIYPW